MAARLTQKERRELTRRQLLDAAAVVFAARGYHAASIDDIADAAGFTKGAVYSNFASKEDLFLALIRERQAQMLEAFFAAAEGGTNNDTTPNTITDVFRRLSPTPEEFALWQEFELYARRQPELLARLRADNDATFAQLVALVEQRWRSLGAEARSPPLRSRASTPRSSTASPANVPSIPTQCRTNCLTARRLRRPRRQRALDARVARCREYAWA